MLFHAELHAFVRLQEFNDLDDIVGPRIAARPEFVGRVERSETRRYCY
jgi:hypothetical protein